MLHSVLDVPTILDRPATSIERFRTWNRPPSIAFTDLERIFADIVETAITEAASIPCSITEYREGLVLMVSRLEDTIASAAQFDRDR